MGIRLTNLELSAPLPQPRASHHQSALHVRNSQSSSWSTGIDRSIIPNVSSPSQR